MSRAKSLNWWQKIALELLWALCWLVSRLPHCVRYGIFADVIYFVFYHVVRYRRGVVKMNLQNSFPEKSEDELLKIERGYYRFLSEIAVATISLANPKGSYDTILRQPYSTDSLEKFVKLTSGGRNCIVLTAHYGIWEYMMFWGHYNPDQRVVAVYRPLENLIFDHLYLRLRNLENVTLVPMNETVRFCLQHPDGVDGKSFFIGLIADQNPPLRPNSHWVKFLNQDTVFFDGGEKLAQKLKMPIVFVYQKRFGRGHYEFVVEPLHDGNTEIADTEITTLYAQKLEEVIKQQPELWLWSHRRWKHKRS